SAQRSRAVDQQKKGSPCGKPLSWSGSASIRLALSIRPQQLLDFAQLHVAVDDVPLRIDQDHRRQGEDAHLRGQTAIETARFVKLRPGELFLLEEGNQLLLLAVQTDSNRREAPLAAVLRHQVLDVLQVRFARFAPS